jgi:hypothetical protein
MTKFFILTARIAALEHALRESLEVMENMGVLDVYLGMDEAKAEASLFKRRVKKLLRARLD